MFFNKIIVNNIVGVKKRAYSLLTRSSHIIGKYRTYNYQNAKQNGVFLEPIKIFTNKYQGEDEASVDKITPVEKKEIKSEVVKKKRKNKK